MITLPSPQADNASESGNFLMAKSENNFDKEYVEMMVNGLKDAIAVIEKASTDYDDPDIHNLATTSLPDMRIHLEFMKKLL